MSVKAAFAAFIGTLGLAALLSAAPAAAQFLDQAPGQRFQIDPNHLARPYATDSVDNTADIVSRPDPPPFKLPPGFSVNEFASGFRYPRWLAVASNGDVFLTLPQKGQVVLLRDGDGDGKAELKTVFAAGFERPHGLAFHDGYLYVADVNRVWRIAWQPGDTRARGKPAPVTGTGVFGSAEGHWSRNLVFSPDGKRFVVTVGSADNLGEDPPVRATLQSFAADGSDQQTLASGLRNSVGITYRPGSSDLYVVVNERDGLGDGLVPDYLTRIEPGGFYGWPYAYIGAHAQPDFPARPDLVAKAIVPDLLFQAHSAPLGLVFYDGKMFPPDYQGDAFVALHGSWNSGKPTGYKIVRVPFKDGRPAGYYENFLTGFWIAGHEPAQVWGRPCDVAVAADGSLLVSDDASGTIWRISYKKP
jgi:glucose/arabinose dehydrogenase